MDGERIAGGRWRRLAGGCVIALFAAVGCSLGGPALSELQPRDCFTGNVGFHPPSIEVIACEEAEPMADYFVVFAEDAVGDTYPGNLEDIRFRCMSEGGRFLSPSSETWDDGDRTALCHKAPMMEGYLE